MSIKQRKRKMKEREQERYVLRENKRAGRGGEIEIK